MQDYDGLVRRTVLLLLVSTMLGLPALAHSQQPSCSWAPHAATTRDAILFGVDAVDPSSTWAVGSVRGADDWSRTLVRHWDGTEWATQPSPSVEERRNELNDVVGLPDGTAWAVGSRSRTTMKTIVQRYDGTRWRMQRSLNPSKTLNALYAVDVTPGGTVYAVGTRRNARRLHRTMILRFDGETWQTIPSPLAGSFYDVDAIADDDVWVVGSRDAGPLAIHYDGESWTKAELPVDSYSSLFAVSAAAPDDVWAVGEYTEDETRPLILHFDGTTWSTSELPEEGLRFVGLRSVSAPRSDYAVTVGQRDQWEFGVDRRVVLEWDGSTWAEAPREHSTESDRLEAVDATADGSAWAVGYHGNYRYHSTHPQTSYVMRRTCT